MEAGAADEDCPATGGGETVEHVDACGLVVGHGELALGLGQVEQVVADSKSGAPASGLAVPMSMPR